MYHPGHRPLEILTETKSLPGSSVLVDRLSSAVKYLSLNHVLSKLKSIEKHAFCLAGTTLTNNVDFSVSY